MKSVSAYAGINNYGAYDGKDSMVKITNPLKQTISFSDYEANDKPQTIVDANNVTSKLTYTEDGWLATTTTDGAITRLFYDNVGNLTKLILPDETTFSYVYDDANYLMEIHAPYGTIKYTRDNAGNITKQEINGGVYSDQRTYDEINRLLKITTAISTQSFSYDNDDNPATSTDGRSNKTSFAFDALQRLSQITDAKNGATKYGYDNTQSIEDPTSITDAKGTNTLYKYNGLRNLLSLVSPDSGTHAYSAHDGNGNLLEQTDARGQLISYSYDALNRPKTISYSADPSQNTTFTYDNGTNAVGRLTKVANGTSSNSYYYDARGNTTNEVQRIDGNDYSLTYAYDKADHLTNIVYPSKNQVVYTYTNGQVSKVIADGKTIAEVSHMPFGPINQIAYGNGLTETIAYNTDYSIKNLSLSNDLLNRDYTYYPNGQIKSIRVIPPKNKPI